MRSTRSSKSDGAGAAVLGWLEPIVLVRGGLAGLALLGLWHALGGPDPVSVVSHLPVVCPFRRLTGLPCPGCGMTRALAALAAGRLEAAWAFHPLAVPLLAVATLWAVLPGRWRALAARPAVARRLPSAFSIGLLVWWVATRLF